MAKATKKVTKKTAKKTDTTARPTRPISGALADLRAKLNMAQIDSRTSGGPKWTPQRGLSFVVEDALVRVATVNDEEVHIVQYKLLGLDGENKDKRHVEEVWLNQDWKFNAVRTDVTVLGGDWPDEFGDDPLVDLGAALVSIKDTQGIADVWKKDEHVNIRIVDGVEGAGSGDQNDEDSGEAPDWTEAEIRDLPEEDDGDLQALAEEHGISWDLEFDDIKDELVKLLC